jgi:hypothetical protein
MLDAGEVFAAGRRLQAEHVFHHKNSWPEELDVAQVFEEEQAALIFDEPPHTTVCAVALPGPLKNLGMVARQR